MKKGFLFTLDSIFALVISLIIITAILFSIKTINSNSWSDINLNELSMDYLTSLELDGTLRDSVQYSTTNNLKVFLNLKVRENICANIEIFDSTDALLMTETKTGCTSSYKIEVTKRTFIYDGEVYYAVFEGWYSE